MMPIAIRTIPTIPAGLTKPAALERAPSGDQIHDQDDDRDDEEQVNQGTTEMTDETEEPENQEHHEDSPKHMFSFELVSFASRVGARVRLTFLKIPPGSFKPE